MFSTELYSNFCFLKINFNKFHYTDNRQGSPYNYFAYMQKGSAKIVSKDKTIFVNEGELFYIPQNLGYQSYWYGDEEISFFSYGCSDLFAYDARLLDLQVIECPHEISDKLISIPADGANILMHNIGVFFSIVADLLPYMKKISLSTEKNIIAKAKKYLQSNPHCSNKQLAAECNISLPYLYKIFKAHDGETPNSYRQKALCNQAANLLTGTDLSIEQISSILNFSSSVYFRKIFKEHVGQTPREFRKSHSF